MERQPRDGTPALRGSAAPTTDGKIVIGAVVSHAKLLAEIEARNPIVANRHKAAAARAGGSNR